VEIVPRGLGEQLLGGDGAAGEDRIRAATEAGIPMIVAPGGFDQVSVGAQSDWRARFGERQSIVIDEARVEMRTSPAECASIGRELADRLNRALVPGCVLVPTCGFSSLDRPGRALPDPEADASFTSALQAARVSPQVSVQQLPLNLYDPEFGDVCAEAFLEVWVGSGRSLPTPGRAPVGGAA
jgi:uncharacterized protein (UPF0261 family)